MHITNLLGKEQTRVYLQKGKGTLSLRFKQRKRGWMSFMEKWKSEHINRLPVTPQFSK